VGARTFHPDLQGPIKILRSRVFTEGVREAEPGAILPVKDRLLVSCGEGVLEVTDLQAPGSRALPAQEYLRGNRLEGSFSS
jgi:methionyl-tRNA formyltransferase